MTAQTFDAKEIERRMLGAIASLKQHLNGLRTGRANPNLLDPIQVDAYGQKMACGSILAVGSSSKSTFDCFVSDNTTQARAKATRCCCPCDNVLADRVASASKPTRAKASKARVLTAAQPVPANHKPIATLACTLMRSMCGR